MSSCVFHPWPVLRQTHRADISSWMDSGIETQQLSNRTFSVLFQIFPSHFPISSIHSLSRVRLFVTPWTAARQASLSITNSQSLLKVMCIKSVIPSNHLILCCPLLLPPAIFPSIRFFSNESVIHIRQPKYWSFSLNISPSNEF